MTTELLFRDDAYLRAASARVLTVLERGFTLDRTVFYPQGGGQAGDSGTARRASGEPIRIADTRKGDSADEVLHVLAPGSPTPEPGEPLALEIDRERRHRPMRLPTAPPLPSRLPSPPGP